TATARWWCLPVGQGSKGLPIGWLTGGDRGDTPRRLTRRARRCRLLHRRAQSFGGYAMRARGDERENPLLASRVFYVRQTNPDLATSAIAERFNVTPDQVRALLQFERERLARIDKR